MNVSMHDTFNLAWKLNLVLRNLALPSLLSTYDLERRQIAQQLIEFDAEHAVVVQNGDLAELNRNLEENIGFISGVGVEFGENMLNAKGIKGWEEGRKKGKLRAGMVLPPFKVTRYIDANPVDIQLDIPLHSQFRIYFIACNIHFCLPFLDQVCAFIDFTESVLGRMSTKAEISYREKKVTRTEEDEYLQPERCTQASKLFTPALVTMADKSQFEIEDLPALFRKSPWTVYLDDVDPEDGNCTDKWHDGLDDQEVVIVNVRPDGYVGSVGRFRIEQGLEAQEWLDEYYGGFLNHE